MKNSDLKYPSYACDKHIRDGIIVLDTLGVPLTNLTKTQYRYLKYEMPYHNCCNSITLQDQKGERMSSAKLKMLRRCMANFKSLKKLKSLRIPHFYL